MSVERIDYLHDTAYPAHIEIDSPGWVDGAYQLHITLSDPTDYGRLQDMVAMAFRRLAIKVDVK